ncbi:MAG: CcoQ/FixQ family Cbb3-type cytochrome c oxidase assembly chaperone [Alphaproteobacteria bacterium PA4]|nr:MAG: CcoQ/FixQ family Cbb3-type cytochrome c oxidase assembly chaperone [Alphaproteobacteria bacterium PA4]
MSYDELRHLADSWGLVMMGVLFVIFIGWTFRPGAPARMQEAATMIFDDEVDDDQAH